jgi:hypothetical protein
LLSATLKATNPFSSTEDLLEDDDFEVPENDSGLFPDNSSKGPENSSSTAAATAATTATTTGAKERIASAMSPDSFDAMLFPDNSKGLSPNDVFADSVLFPDNSRGLMVSDVFADSAAATPLSPADRAEGVFFSAAGADDTFTEDWQSPSPLDTANEEPNVTPALKSVAFERINSTRFRTEYERLIIK